jgi:5-hydroxyisourate hydrolase
MLLGEAYDHCEEINLGRLTTHVLDTASGKPAKQMALSLYTIEGNQRHLIKETTTNDDGRCSQPLLEGSDFKTGTYELVFQVSAYFSKSSETSNPPFLGEVPIRFSIADASAHYHVPLLVSPWSYSTYRGS